MAGKLDIVIEQGADFERQLVWQQADGTPYDLTGYTARMQARETKLSDTVLLSITVGAGLTLGGVAGTIDIELTAAQTQALEFTTGFWDLELVSGTGKVYRLVEGVVTLSQEVTR